MDILTRMRNMTPESLAGVRTDFDDAPAPVYRTKQPKNMIRVVEGADDLVHPNAGSGGGTGMSIAQDWTDRTDLGGESGHNGDTCNNRMCCSGPTTTPGMSDRQRETINGLILQLADLGDTDTWKAAVEYTRKMNENNAWTPGKEGNASRWIGNLIKKVRELKAIAAATPKPSTGDADAPFQAIPNGYYAINDSGAPDDIHFFRVSRFRDGGIKVQEQASDELHPVRRGGRRTAILKAILSVGPAAASALYGQTIGRCGRCNRTLTDALSRSRGIGPDCWDKM